VYALITSATRKPDAGQRSADPRQILDGRLARGEIDTAEYQRLRDMIAPGDHQAPAGTGGRR
jgi:uncharacterized membrane protein